MRSRIRRALASGGTIAIATLAACSGDTEDSTTSSTSTTTTVPADASTTTSAPPAEGTLDQIELATQEIAEVDDPTALAARPSTPDLYVAEKGGRVRIVKVTPATSSTPARYQLQNTPVLDLSDEVINEGEQGLLGLAFSSDGRKLYVDLTAEPDGRTLVLEYELGDRTTIDTSSRRELLEVEQPYANHNGGQLVTGPDGYLYVGLGDGGAAGDPHGHGQDATTLLGSILRIDPVGGTDDEPYAIPPGNPFVNDEDAAPETWLFGVRNPWRFSFDGDNGDLWIADVGQDAYEEINRLPATGGFDAGRGANLGWNAMEGTHPFEGGENPDGAILPIFEYGRDRGCSITGGYVYRGDAIRPLQGTYLFADFCERGIRGIQVDEGTVIDERTWDLPADEVQSFGEDRDGELFVLLRGGPILKLVARS